MPNINLAKDRLLNVEARINQKSVPVILTFKNRVGGVDTNRDITGDNIILEVYKSPFLERTTSYVFRLAVGSGLTIQGADNHQLKVEVTAAQATQWPDIYTWLLISLTEGVSWLSGEWEFFSGARDNPATDIAEIVISDQGDEIIIIIDGGGGTSSNALEFGDHDASTGSFPTDEDYTFFRVTVEGIIDGRQLYPGAILIRMQVVDNTNNWNQLTGWREI